MKFTIAVNSKLDPGAQFNAFGHAALGIGRRVCPEGFRSRTFTDTRNNFLAEMTDHPLIALTARNDRHLYQVHVKALELGIMCNAFVTSMFDGSAEEQQRAIADSELGDQTYAALALFGEDEDLRKLTRKFSLLRN